MLMSTECLRTHVLMAGRWGTDDVGGGDTVGALMVWERMAGVVQGWTGWQENVWKEGYWRRREWLIQNKERKGREGLLHGLKKG